MRREDVELGDEIEVRKRPTRDVVVSVRLTERDAEGLMALAEQKDTTISSLAREALIAFLDRASMEIRAQVTTNQDEDVARYTYVEGGHEPYTTQASPWESASQAA